ncbi:hypothetical protein ACF08N_13915 [Streptomyces sp. NPDC015127]|uniref:hypothetical protein n=1 Tax=Streptomyces sp. NPDC015127 TaxID=3364939 RepID=UPI0036F83588
MTTPANAPLKSPTGQPTGTAAAEPAAPASGGGAPKVVARQGVLSAVRPDQQPGDGRYPVAWLHISAPGRGAIPTATSRCTCGRDRSAVGHRQVHALIADHTAHRDLCPLRTASQEGRTAA